jgi:hypothetical protein
MKNLFYILPLLLIGCKTVQAQPPQNGGGIGSVKTEQYVADFEKKQSIDSVADYDGSVQVPIQLLKIGINEELNPNSISLKIYNCTSGFYLHISTSEPRFL